MPADAALEGARAAVGAEAIAFDPAQHPGAVASPMVGTAYRARNRAPSRSAKSVAP